MCVGVLLARCAVCRSWQLSPCACQHLRIVPTQVLARRFHDGRALAPLTELHHQRHELRTPASPDQDHNVRVTQPAQQQYLGSELLKIIVVRRQHSLDGHCLAPVRRPVNFTEGSLERERESA